MALRLALESLSQSGRYFLQGSRDLPLANDSDDGSLHSKGAMKRSIRAEVKIFTKIPSPLAWVFAAKPSGGLLSVLAGLKAQQARCPPANGISRPSSSTSFLSELLSPTCPPRGSSQTSPNPRIAGWMPMIAD
ncbi:uncharacterized protein PGTG_07240 [Puccinia graminis f. sp. tritici CRL 75-36-700-3]|uniref:Uncharacterized protein n=1 Tax=Puccinia graminis f. sp. tritici (strain CRL 75-36-700-3 / race SCCL) TaxID=418459 RepID=E3KA06_PUCGT|nr:uncharacterized protein PGTG_07240 [Puccinia graminis f. sp. tritici CRL 75-36-700-3]EFP80988.2 hypothetical protein PGTG_07240 [Puccinia graminis f. sp. tritici CRL 75-36-700-3]